MGSSKLSKTDFEKQLTSKLGEFRNDPLGFVRFVYPWGTKGAPLEKFEGPDTWQTEFLERIGSQIDEDPSQLIREAVASSHGVGKSALSAWLIHWFMSTRYLANVVVTANTGSQLYTKTFREVSVWVNMSINDHWFDITATKMTHVSNKDWVTNAIVNNPQKPESIAGTHAEHVLVIFDEASAIEASIYEAIYGAMSTPGAIWITLGNPTKSHGPFFDSFSLTEASLGEHVM